MANFYAQITGQITPIEETTLTDGTDKTRSIHSQLDTVFSGSFELSLGTVSTKIRKNELTTTTALAGNPLTSGNWKYLFVRIKSSVNENPDCAIRITTPYDFFPLIEYTLDGLDAWCLIPRISGYSDFSSSILSAGSTGFDSSQVEFQSTASNKVCTLEIVEIYS